MLLLNLKSQKMRALSVVALAFAVTSCNSVGSPMAFAKPSLGANAYQADISSCTESTNETKASDGEKTGAVVFSLLMGGFVGAAAAGSAYEESEQRVFEECMYRKGYQMLEVPNDYHTVEPTDEFDKVLPQEMSLELIEENKMAELLDWNEAVSLGSKEALTGYIVKYPQGFYIQEARDQLNKSKEPQAKVVPK